MLGHAAPPKEGPGSTEFLSFHKRIKISAVVEKEIFIPHSHKRKVGLGG